MTFFRSDFIDYGECEILVKDATRLNNLIGIGITFHKFIEINGKYILLSCISNHLTQTDVLLSLPRPTIKYTLVTL